MWEVIGAVIELGSTITSVVNDGGNRRSQLALLTEKGEQDRSSSKENLNLLMQTTREKIKYQTTITNLQAQQLKDNDASIFSNWKNDPKLGLTCSKVYDETGSLSPLCIDAGFTAENIEGKRQADRQRNYKISVVAIIIILGTVFYFAQKNK
tara:strand:+ start:804 stop:1259 length:456 start_codon:yes stop_codon:yes gene_type:complete